MLSPLPHRVPILRGLYRRLSKRDVTGGMKRRTGILAKKSGLEKARGAGRRVIVAAVNQKRHEMHESCRLIRPLASKIFTRTAVSFSTGMRPLRCHSATISGGKPSRRGAISRFVVTEMSQFVLCFLFLFEQSRHHPELPIGMRSVHALCILLARISTWIFRMERSALHSKSSSLPYHVSI